ncbi:BA75_04809T0 [Komagataella pastoris]|uniref:BA75_04809T0 n=1 Tax=Komagataella pastoris TaxID=4922 RepID=A0A1B2JJI9_PICPA|nr:BA75_04809T0 [Komagataella pastoris]
MKLPSMSQYLSPTMKYRCKSILYTIERPFKNLTVRARVLQIWRLSLSVLVMTLVLVQLIGPFLNPTKIYLARLECSHVDLSKGLFNTLRDSVSTNSEDLSGQLGPGLTASEIKLLSAYAMKQVEDAPQFILSNLLNWCFGTYNNHSLTDQHYHENRITSMQCTSKDFNYNFDYRGELSSVGLQIILSYAYKLETTLTSPNDQYTPDHKYFSTIQKRQSLNKLATSLLLLGVCLQFVLLVSALVMYSHRGSARDDKNVNINFRSFLSSIAIGSFTCLATAIITLLVMYANISQDVKNELSQFGLSVHLGPVFFKVGWVILSASCLLAFLWAFPTWCGAPTRKTENPEKTNEKPTQLLFPSDEHSYRDSLGTSVDISLDERLQYQYPTVPVVTTTLPSYSKGFEDNDYSLIENRKNSRSLV